MSTSVRMWFHLWLDPDNEWVNCKTFLWTWLSDLSSNQDLWLLWIHLQLPSVHRIHTINLFMQKTHPVDLGSRWTLHFTFSSRHPQIVQDNSNFFSGYSPFFLNDISVSHSYMSGILLSVPTWEEGREKDTNWPETKNLLCYAYTKIWWHGSNSLVLPQPELKFQHQSMCRTINFCHMTLSYMRFIPSIQLLNLGNISFISDWTMNHPTVSA